MRSIRRSKSRRDVMFMAIVLFFNLNPPGALCFAPNGACIPNSVVCYKHSAPSGARTRRHQLSENANNMKKASAKKNSDDLRPEYDLSTLKGGVRGKYYRKATAGTNLVLIEPELTNVFPDTESVNRALRLLADTAASATERSRRPSKTRDKRLKRSA